MNQQSYGNYILAQIDNLRLYLVCEERNAITANTHQTTILQASKTTLNSYHAINTNLRRLTTSELENSLNLFNQQLAHLEHMQELGSEMDRITKDSIADAIYRSVCNSLPKIEGRKKGEEHDYLIWMPLEKLLYEE